MKKLILGVAAGAILVVAGAGAANATVFGGKATFTDTSSGNNGLTVDPASVVFASGNITAGHSSYLTGFMTVGTEDSNTGSWHYTFPFGFTDSGTTVSDNVRLTLAWTQPSGATDSTFGGVVTETTYFTASLDHGQLLWSGDTHHDSNGTYASQDVLFADGAMATIRMYDSYLDGTTSSLAAKIDMQIFDTKDPTNVPEPGGLVLMGTGLLGLGMVAQRRGKRSMFWGGTAG